MPGRSLSFQRALERFLSALSRGSWLFNTKCLRSVALSFPALASDFRDFAPSGGVGGLSGYFSPLSSLFPRPLFGLLSHSRDSWQWFRLRGILCLGQASPPTNFKNPLDFLPVSPDRVFTVFLCASAHLPGRRGLFYPAKASFWSLVSSGSFVSLTP